MGDTVSKQIKNWTETEKAFWIMEHGEPKLAWVFERNGETVYKRPIADPSTILPPWISTEREDVTDMIFGNTIDKLYLDDIT
jgi:hypothetical protein